MDTTRIFLRFGQRFCSEKRAGTYGASALLARVKRKPPRGDFDSIVFSLNVLFALLTGAVDIQRGTLL